MIFDNNFIGKNGFFWFIGVVEDRKDPLKLGRVRVRCFGWHTDNKSLIPTEALPWAIVAQSTASAAMDGIGETGGLVEGSWVVGFFIDGVEAQEPMVMFSFPGLQLSARNTNVGFSDPRESLSGSPVLAAMLSYALKQKVAISNSPAKRFPRNSDTPGTPERSRGISGEAGASKSSSRSAHVGVAGAGGSTTTEPVDPFGAVYPYNKVKQTESGHLMEFDDTPGKERVHLFHRSGSFLEFHPDGDVVFKSVGDAYELVNNNSHEHVGNSKNLTIGGNFNILVKSGSNINIRVVSGNANVDITGNVTTNVTGNVNETIGGNVTRNITGNLNETIGGTRTSTSSGTTTINGSTVRLN